MRRRNKPGPERANLRTNQLNNQNILLTGVLPAARGVLSTITGWLRVVRLLSINGDLQRHGNGPQAPTNRFPVAHTEPDRHLTA